GSCQPLEVGILASPEYYALHGSDPSQWLSAVYQDALKRSPDPAGVAAWNALLSGGSSRVAVAAGIAASHEAHLQAATDAYHMFLGRDPEAAGLATWTSGLDQGMSLARMIAGFADSPEL